MKYVFFIFTTLLISVLFSCKSEEKNNDFWIIYEWFYKEKSLDRKIDDNDDENKIVIDRNEKIRKYLIDNFKEENEIDTKWIFKHQTFEVKTTDFKGSIIEVISYFEYKNENLCVIDRYFYSLNLLKPKQLESNTYYFGHENKDVNYKSLWNNKLSLF